MHRLHRQPGRQLRQARGRLGVDPQLDSVGIAPLAEPDRAHAVRAGAFDFAPEQEFLLAVRDQFARVAGTETARPRQQVDRLEQGRLPGRVGAGDEIEGGMEFEFRDFAQTAQAPDLQAGEPHRKPARISSASA